MRSRSRTLWDYVVLVAFVCATYPVALIGLSATDWLYGDAELVRAAAYGPGRALAAALVDAWTASMIWVLACWLLLGLAGHFAFRAGRIAILAVGAALVAASAARLMAVPAMVGWLLLTTGLLQAVYRQMGPRRP